MTQKNIDKGVNMVISIIVSVTAVMLTMSLTSSDLDARELKDSIKCKASITYVNEQNKAQDLDLDHRFEERDKMNAMILEELNYIKLRVDRIPTK